MYHKITLGLDTGFYRKKDGKGLQSGATDKNTVMWSQIQILMMAEPSVARSQRSKIGSAFWVREMAYSLSSINHSKTSQLLVSIELMCCMSKRPDSAFLCSVLCSEQLWHSSSTSAFPSSMTVSIFTLSAGTCHMIGDCWPVNKLGRKCGKKAQDED